jgi:hypothetical protein
MIYLVRVIAGLLYLLVLFSLISAFGFVVGILLSLPVSLLIGFVRKRVYVAKNANSDDKIIISGEN